MMGMNQTFATVRQGQTHATFPISLPRNKGISDVNKKCLGTPKHIGFFGKPPNIDYRLEYAVLADSKTYSFQMKTGPQDKTTGKDMLQKLQNHLTKMGTEEYPLLFDHRLPYITYNEEVDRFEIDLPAKTSLYSSNEFLWPGLGFETNSALLSTTKDIGPKRGKKTRTRVFGFFNLDDTVGETVLAEKPMNLKDTMAEFLNILPEEFGNYVTVQVEISDGQLVPVELMNNRGTDKPVTKKEAIRQLTTLFDLARRRAGLRENLIDIVPGHDNIIYVTNRIFPKAGVGFTLLFSEAMSNALGITPGQLMTFNFEAPRTFQLSVQDSVSDPFTGKYPVQLRQCGFGEATSVREGNGTIAIIAFLNEKTDRHPIISQGVVFTTDRTYLTVEFTDKNGDVIAFDRDLQIGMLLTFKML